jgi:hypothetical protein
VGTSTGDSTGAGVADGERVVGVGVGRGDTVGTAAVIETLAQLKNCSGQAVDRVPSEG